jgi:hypothetical protein
MKTKPPPSWQKSVDAQNQKARARTIELMSASKTYPRPPRDLDMVWTSIGGKIGIVDKRSGDVLLHVGATTAERTNSFQFTSKAGDVVRTFYTQWGAGYFGEWDSLPIRVFAIKDATPSKAATAGNAEEVIPLSRLAKFLSSHPAFVNTPDKQFILFEALAGEGERL